jgi:hypothetical protein
MLGSDKQGRAVLLIQAKKHKAWTRKLEELELYVCYLLDAAVSSPASPHSLALGL